MNKLLIDYALKLTKQREGEVVFNALLPVLGTLKEQTGMVEFAGNTRDSERLRLIARDLEIITQELSDELIHMQKELKENRKKMNIKY